jgi:peptide/nickel transport system substrate-binding protein
MLAMAVPAAAQEEVPGPGEGGIIIEGNFGDDPGSFNPLFCSGTDCFDDAIQFMFPALVGVDVTQATMMKGAPDALALDWSTEDGFTYIYTLRDDLFWTDGEPVTAYDVEWTWDVTADPEAASSNAWLTDIIADIVAIDDYTLEVTFQAADCNGVLYSGSIRPVPRHVFEGIPMNELEANEFSTNPNVSSGVFTFGEFRSGEQWSMIANQDYPDTELGYVVPAGRIVRIVPDQTVMIEQFLAGELSAIRNPPADRRSDVRAQGDTGDVQVYNYPGDTWDYLAFNLADPTNPLPGVDEDGNIVDQGHHPIFGDVRVRQAIARAIDVEAIIQGAVFGEGTRMASFIVPGSWAVHPDLEPIPFDTADAEARLEEAGWIDEDGDGVRECHGCMYAEEGSPLEFELWTNEGNTRRNAIAIVVQDQLAQVGIQVNFQALEWNTLLDRRNTQEYDAIIVGWRAGYPDDPDPTQLFGPQADVPGICCNFTSYYNEEFIDLMEQARTLPGCDPQERAELYWRMQEIMQEDLPYVWLFVQDGMYAARSDVNNFNPYPAQAYWNIDTWHLESAE